MCTYNCNSVWAIYINIYIYIVNHLILVPDIFGMVPTNCRAHRSPMTAVRNTFLFTLLGGLSQCAIGKVLGVMLHCNMA